MQTEPIRATMKDLTGQKFGRWHVLKFHSRQGATTYRWLCRCECGTEKAVLTAALVYGTSKSCGCLRSEQLVEKHKHAPRLHNKHARTYRIWLGMKTRRHNERHTSNKNYLQRGIEVCERWKNSFPNFLKDMGECPPGMSIERKDNEAGYKPENCIWADRFTQNSNRRDNWRIDWHGEFLTMTQLSQKENVATCSLRNYIAINNMTPPEAVAKCKERGLVYKERAKTPRPI